MLNYMHVCRLYHSLFLWLSYTAPQMERRQEGELCGLLLNGVCRLSKWVMLPFFTLLVQGHLPYTSIPTQLLGSYYACLSITLLTTSDTVEMSDDILLHWKWYVMFNNKIHNLVRVGLSLFYVIWLVSHMFNVWLIFIGWLTVHVMLFSLISFLNSKTWVVENSNVLNG